MNNKYLKQIIKNLLCNDVDGIIKTDDGWHIDDIDRLSFGPKKRKKWYDAAIGFYPIVDVLAQQLQIPWDIVLSFYLKNRKKKNLIEINFKTIKDVKKELDLYTPPEFSIYQRSKDKLFKNEYCDITNKYEFFPLNVEIDFIKIYSKASHSYLRSIDFFLNKKYLFRLMIARLFKNFKITLNDCNYIREEDEKHILEIQKILEKNPNNIELTKELGVLLLLSLNKPNEAKQNLLKVIQLDPKNVDAYFWLAICTYYYFSDLEESKKLIEHALSIDPNRADCLSFLYKICWRLQKSVESPIDYLKRAIHNEPDWILPRIQLIIAYRISEKEDFESIQNEIMKLSKLRQNYTFPNNTIDKYYATYVSGNTTENNLLIDTLISLYELDKKQKNKIGF